MPRVKFLADFDYKPSKQTTVGYLAGMEETVKRDCADQAIAAGKAKTVGRPKQEEADGRSR